MDNQTQTHTTKTRSDRAPFWKRKWLQRMGVGAFLFFFIKGLVWLAVFFGLFSVIGC